ATASADSRSGTASACSRPTVARCDGPSTPSGDVRNACDLRLASSAGRLAQSGEVSAQRGGTPARCGGARILSDDCSAALGTARSKFLTSKKDAAKRALLDNGRQLYQIVQGTPGVSDAQKISLGINVRKSAAPIGA